MKISGHVKTDDVSGIVYKDGRLKHDVDQGEDNDGDGCLPFHVSGGLICLVQEDHQRGSDAAYCDGEDGEC